MNIIITAESTIDLTPELLQKFNIKTIPLKIMLNNKDKLDGNICIQEVVQSVNTTGILPKTSAINVSEYKTFFKSILNEYDAIIHISLSSDLSSTYNHARKAAEIFVDRVHVIDSRTLSTGIALIALYANTLLASDLTIGAIIQKIYNYISKIKTSFIISRLDYLHKGGRCSTIALMGANLLKLKPKIEVKDGKMRLTKKYKGSLKRAADDYCAELLLTPDIDYENIFITYTTLDETIILKLKNKLSSAGFKNIYITQASATIMSHCGEETLGIIFSLK